MPLNNTGFSLIELIVTAVIITILAGVAITAYIGTQEKARIASIIRTASSSTSELHLWLQSSLSDQRGIREVDTNFDGTINGDDKTNGELLNNVANTYVNGRKETSPWFNRPMWNSDNPTPNGTISLIQPLANQLILGAREKNGFIVYENIIYAN